MQTVVAAFHNYTPMYDHKYFNVISDYFLKNFEIWQDEVDQLVILDSNWGIKVHNPKIKVITTNPNLRYYEAYKETTPQLEGKLLFVDNDMVIYRKGVVKKAFDKLDDYDVVSIYDSCGTYKTDKLNGGNKFCPYFFGASKDLLLKYLDVEWGPEMPEYETLGRLTHRMLDDRIRPYEFEEDKTVEGKDLGYYHIRAGSTPAYLLTHRNFGDRKTYDDYLKSQPKSETLRQCKWYRIMGGDPSEIEEDYEKIDRQ